MSLSVKYVNPEGFDPAIIDADNWTLQSAAIKGNLAAVAMLLDKPQIIARAKTTDNSAASEVIDLTDQGLTFVAGGFRTIRFKSVAVTDNDSWTQEYEQVVWGNDGTTPKLLGTARLIRAVGEINGTVVNYGAVKYHGTTSGATVTDGGDAPSGVSLGNFSSGVATLTVPISRSTALMRVEAAHFSEDAGTIGDTRVAQVRAATTTTFTVNVATQNGTEGLTDPTGVNNIDIAVFLPPPPEVKLVMNSTHLELHCSYNATDDVYHDVEVRIGRQELHLHVPD